jgi:SAM-dependent methyltransferase
VADEIAADAPLETRTEWQQFFDWHAPRYLENAFTKHTRAEVDFILSLFPLEGGARILDIGCGAGRHAIEFGRRGFQVTGIDISEGMIRQARRNIEEADFEAHVEFLRADATEWVSAEPFDAAICLCEGGFNLIGQGEDPVTHDLAILQNASQSLKMGAPFVLNALNGYALIRQLPPTSVDVASFDPVTMIATYQDTWNLPEGPTVMQIRERLFIPPEVTAMLFASGFQTLAVYGGTAGNWGRRPLQLDEVEAMFVARKVR